MGSVVCALSDTMIAETALPDRESHAQLLTHRMRGTTFHKLNRALQAKLGGGCDKQMEVLGHQDEGVEPIGSIIPVVQHSRHEHFRSLRVQK